MADQIKSCGVLLVRGLPPTEFLLMVHRDRYDLPKGHVESGETETECALREMEEETGIRPQWVRLDPEFRFETSYPVRPKRFDYRPFLKTTVIFLGYLLREAPIHTTEHQGFEWRPWHPPHCIQRATIDPLLAQLDQFWSQQESR